MEGLGEECWRHLCIMMGQDQVCCHLNGDRCGLGYEVAQICIEGGEVCVGIDGHVEQLGLGCSKGWCILGVLVQGPPLYVMLDCRRKCGSQSACGGYWWALSLAVL